MEKKVVASFIRINGNDYRSNISLGRKPAICDIEELSGKNVAEIFVNYVINEIY